MAELFGFAYGEDLEGMPPRSLGYRLLAPARPESWCGEVEALARRLQAAPYSDHWPPTDLFCSFLLADGRRVVAVARYGLADHTPSHRRGGLELVGVVTAPGLDVRAALTVYAWLRRLREATDDLHRFGGVHSLEEAVGSTSPPEASADPLPVLPVRLWQEGALLFAATTPADPDHRLRLLEQGAGGSWQWLPLVGPDFPLQTYAQRGPLIAWTPHFAGVALKLDHRTPPAGEVPAPRPRRGSGALIGLLVPVALLLAANAWLLFDVRRQLATTGGNRPQPEAPREAAEVPPANVPPREQSTERLLKGLQDLIDQGGAGEGDAERSALLARYERLVRAHPDLRVPEGDARAKRTVAAISLLAERSADRIDDVVRRALSGKGFSDRLIKAAVEHVHEQFATDLKDRP
jgi:hypothetical protein